MAQMAMVMAVFQGSDGRCAGTSPWQPARFFRAPCYYFFPNRIRKSA
jgi:hypothetical protein